RDGLPALVELHLRALGPRRRGAARDVDAGGASRHGLAGRSVSLSGDARIRGDDRGGSRPSTERVSVVLLRARRMPRRACERRALVAWNDDGATLRQGVSRRHSAAAALLQHVLAYARHRLGRHFHAGLSRRSRAMSANHEKLMALDTVPGAEDARGEDLWEGVQGYLIGLVLSALLTALAFFFTGSDWLWGPSIPVALSVLAVAQIGVHLAFFLHLTTAPDSVNNSLALAFGTLIVGLVIGGTLWIMYHMNLNMPPMTQMATPAITKAGSRSATGVIEAASPTPVAAKIAGAIRSIDCEVGAQVRQGQLCATI